MTAASSQFDLDQTLGALADPTRRAILERLSRGEARVTELARPFDISLNSVSKHIRRLELAGLVRRRRAGREHFLSLNPHLKVQPPVGAGFKDCLEHLFAQALEHQHPDHPRFRRALPEKPL